MVRSSSSGSWDINSNLLFSEGNWIKFGGLYRTNTCGGELAFDLIELFSNFLNALLFKLKQIYSSLCYKALNVKDSVFLLLLESLHGC